MIMMKKGKIMMLNDNDQVIITLHKSQEPDSRYLKVTVENKLEQLANFFVSAYNVPLIRFFDKFQDKLLVEYKNREFYANDEGAQLKENIKKIVAKATMIANNECTAELVRISNYWMSEEYNNYSVAVEIIKKYSFKIDYLRWM